MLPDGSDTAAAGHQRRRRGVPPGPRPGPPRRRPGPTTPGRRRGRRTRASGSSASTRSPATSCSASAPTAGSTCALLPLDDLAGRRRGRRTRRTTAGSSTSPAHGEYDVVVGHRLRPVVGAPAGVVGRRPDHRGPHRAAPQGGARRTTRRRTSPSGAPSRRPDGTPVPATLIRHRDTPLDGTAPALLYGYGAYESILEPEWDPALPQPARPRRRLRARARPRRRRGRPALVARRAAGAPSSTPSTTTSRWPTGWPRRAGRRRPDRHPRPERRRPAPGRGVQPAPGPLAGGRRRGAVRRRGHHDVRRDASR